MSHHALGAAAVAAVLSLPVLGPPVQAQDTWTTQELAELRARAEAGDASAQYYLGDRYDIGLDVPEDKAEAVRWFRLAAEQGYARAQVMLGWMYRFG